MPVNSELVAKLLQPIPGEAPAGKDLRYDARVDAIKEARREDPDLPRRPEDGPRKLADWPAVIKATVDLLTTETKDLQLQVWLTEALLNKEGFSGFATGLEGLGGLLSQYWETVHPLPEDDDLELRIGPLELIGAKLALPVKMTPLGGTGVTFMKYALSREVPAEAEGETDRQKRIQREEALAQGKPSPESIDAILEAMNKGAVRAIIAEIDQVVTSLMAVEKLSDEKFGRDAPAFNALRNAIDEIRRFLAGLLAQKLELDPDPEVDEVAATEATAADDGGVLTAEPTSRADAAQRIGVVARWLRQQDATNPAPYLLLRGFRWGELRANAPDLDPKLLEAPATATRAKLKTLKLDGKWSELLEQSENLMATAPGRGWLDLQRYVLTALANLGSGHDAVAAAIRSELKGLLRAVPQITRMTLMDDTPTANEETREWLEQEGLMPTPDELEAAEPEAASPEEDVEMTDGSEALVEALDDDAASAHQGGFTRTRAVRPPMPRGRDAFDLARGELAQGRPNRAIEVLMADLAREQSPRGRFVRQTQIAYVMVESGLDGVAMPILQRLVETIDERTLEQWESGPVVAQPMALLCRVYDRLGVREDDRAELYLRVCRLDPIQAIALSPR
jgi:type VI secretion system protein ImpA